jgi:hypothetical protein
MQGDESIAAGNCTTELFDAGERFLFIEYQQKDNFSQLLSFIIRVSRAPTTVPAILSLINLSSCHFMIKIHIF